MRQSPRLESLAAPQVGSRAGVAAAFVRAERHIRTGSHGRPSRGTTCRRPGPTATTGSVVEASFTIGDEFADSLLPSRARGFAEQSWRRIAQELPWRGASGAGFQES
jgi:hypothetical protein